MGKENKILVHLFIIHSTGHRYYMVPIKAELSIWEAVANTVSKDSRKVDLVICVYNASSLEAEAGESEVQIIFVCIESSRTAT